MTHLLYCGSMLAYIIKQKNASDRGAGNKSTAGGKEAARTWERGLRRSVPDCMKAGIAGPPGNTRRTAAYHRVHGALSVSSLGRYRVRFIEFPLRVSFRGGFFVFEGRNFCQ